MVLTGALMLNALGHSEAAIYLEDKVEELLQLGSVTADIKRSLGQDPIAGLGTKEVGERLIQLIEA